MKFETPYYSRVPKDRAANLRFRRRMVRLGAESDESAEALRTMCARDPLFYVNAFCFLFEPRQAQRVPFITWDYQDDAFREIIEAIGHHDLVIEKSRDMGASWMCVTAIEWVWHFHDLATFLLLSRKEELVDSKGGDPKSLFAKIDFIHAHQPKWLVPRKNRMQMHMDNLDRGGSIDGESTNRFAGVADRRLCLLLDEFSRMDNQDSIFQGTRDVADSRIFNFTPEGSLNTAYRVAHNPNFRKLTLHWSRHPVKSAGLYSIEDDGSPKLLDDRYWRAGRVEEYEFQKKQPAGRFKLRSPWYDAQCLRAASSREIAQELDIDYVGSTHRYFEEAELQSAITRCDAPWLRGELEYHAEIAAPTLFKPSPGGNLLLWTHLDGAGDPPHDRAYVIGVDPSAGTGATNSAVVIGDIQTGAQVGEFATPFLRPDQLARYVVALCRWLHDAERRPAFLIWEAPGPGREFGSAVFELGHYHVFYWKYAASASRRKTRIAGWFPTRDDKRAVLGEYRKAVLDRRFGVRSALQLEECAHYVYQPNGWIEHLGQSGRALSDPSGARENHGDRPMAGALCWLAMNQLNPALAALTPPAVLPTAADATPWVSKSPEEYRLVTPKVVAPYGSMMWCRRYHEAQRLAQSW